MVREPSYSAESDDEPDDDEDDDDEELEEDDGERVSPIKAEITCSKCAANCIFRIFESCFGKARI